MAGKKVNIQTPAPQSTNRGADDAIAGHSGRKKDTRKQLGIKVSMEVYDDLQIIERIHKNRGESWNMTMVGAQLLADYVEEHRDEINKYKELMKSLE